ncbi:helix-turn-helix domain-containing protein [Streptomyces sp. NPDC088757]|uniref:helix-turn-helix domain-containing protein n=1 Tax=Streptomyces sp. NPDC088757 TaxID=3365889 RepID=UPI003803FEC2
MPPRAYPTARQKRLGAELRKLRERAGLSGADVARFLGGERAVASHIESGRYGVSAERVRWIAAHCSATDKHLVNALAAMAEERGKGWWEEWRGRIPPGFLDLAELEHHAVYLRTIDVLHIPGLLQTQEYAKDLILSSVSQTSAEVDVWVEFRMRRREILDRPQPPKFQALIHEAALRMRYCRPETMRKQLEFLVEAASWPGVAIRVVPFSEQITGSVHSMLYAGANIPQLDTVQLDSAFDGEFLHAEPHLIKYRTLLDSVEGISLDVAESRKFIRRIAQEM